MRENLSLITYSQMKICLFKVAKSDTVDGERFIVLNICGFSAIEVFTEILSCYLGHMYSLFSTIKESHLNS